MEALRQLLASDDVRSIALAAASVVVGLLAAAPSPRVVHVAVACVATSAALAWIARSHARADDATRADAAAASRLFASTKAERRAHAPLATLVHPEVARVLASLAPLSRPGRRGAVRAVARATEAVVRAYHEGMLEEAPDGRPRHAASSDLADRTGVALDALQALRMQAGGEDGPAGRLARDADRALRALFSRLAQILANRSPGRAAPGAPRAWEPGEDRHLVR